MGRRPNVNERQGGARRARRNGFERRHEPLAPTSVFLSRVARAAGLSLALVAATLAAGVIGYRGIAGLRWVEAFQQAALLLSGMGPVVTDLNDAGRIFESFYALFCGVVLLGAAGVLFAPIVHRLLHRFHLEDADDR
jgi:hypothetical protein